MEQLVLETAVNLVTSAVQRCVHSPVSSNESHVCRPCTEKLVAGLLAAAPELQK